MNKNIRKKVLFSILVIVIIIAVIFAYISQLFKPLAENKRNISTSSVKMLVSMEDWRTPIIRTYTKEEFDNLSEEKLNKIKSIVDGNIEGDIPALEIKDGKGTLKISFKNTQKSSTDDIKTNVVPDDIPKIKITAFPTIGLDLPSLDKPKEINDILEKNKDKRYSYEIKKYYDQDQTYYDGNDEFYMESMFIEVHYKISNKDYISIFAINTIEYRDKKINHK